MWGDKVKVEEGMPGYLTWLSSKEGQEAFPGGLMYFPLREGPRSFVLRGHGVAIVLTPEGWFLEADDGG